MSTRIVINTPSGNVYSEHPVSNMVITNPVHGDPIGYSSNGSMVNAPVVWIDLLGEITTRSGGGASAPVVKQFDAAGVYFENATDGGSTQLYFAYHIPHHYKPNTDSYIHLHHSVANSSTGKTVWLVHAAFAKLGDPFPAFKKLANIEYTYQGLSDVRRHIVTEIPLSSAGGSATTLANSELEVDGVLLVRMRRERNANGDTMVDEPVFLFFGDCHLQAVSSGTQFRAPPFR